MKREGKKGRGLRMDLGAVKMKRKEEMRHLEEQRLAEEKIGLAVRSLLTEGARTRLNNVRLVNSDLYLRVVQVILYLNRAGQLQEKVSEEELKQLLERASSKREIKIKRK